MRGYHPDFGHSINVAAHELSDDPDTQVSQVIGMMRAYAKPDGESSELRADALHAIANGSGDPISDNFFDIANATYRRTGGRHGIKFVPDDETAAPFASFLPHGDIVETLVRPLDMRLMRHKRGDCDDFSMTMAARLVALGVPCSFVTVAVDYNDPSRYSHVYVAAYPNGRRVALDASHGDYPGWEAPNRFGKRAEWPLDGGFGVTSTLLLGLAIAAAGYAVGSVVRGGR